MELIYRDILKNWMECWQEAVIAGIVFMAVGRQIYSGRRQQKKVYVVSFADGVFLYYLLYVTLISRSAGSRREVVLLPFMGAEILSGDYHYVIENVLLFIPFGVLLNMTLCAYGKKSNIKIILLSALLTSLSVEILQYCLSCGKSETDDVLANVTGALIGYGIAKLTIMPWHFK